MTVINNPPATQTSDSSGTGTLLAVVLIVILAILFFVYGLPALRGSTSSPNINVPGKVDVNVRGVGGTGK